MRGVDVGMHFMHRNNAYSQWSCLAYLQKRVHDLILRERGFALCCLFDPSKQVALQRAQGV